MLFIGGVHDCANLTTYLGSDLVNNMATCQISNLVRIPNSNIKTWSCGLFYAHTRLCLPFWTIRSYRGRLALCISPRRAGRPVRITKIYRVHHTPAHRGL